MKRLPKHIAIIMDGNRRWAREHDKAIQLGHKEGAETLKKTARYANKIGIEYLTVYAFSTENWKRSEEEIGALMLLFRNYVEELVKAADTQNIKVKFIGSREGLSESIIKSMEKATEKTKDNNGLTLCIAFNYGGRNEILNATKKIAEDVKNNIINVDDIDEKLFPNYLYTKDIPDPDLIIRTSGEMRLSGFLLWQLAYAEFIFVNKYWPDFSEKDLDDAISTYEKRDRKFGGK